MKRVGNVSEVTLTEQVVDRPADADSEILRDYVAHRLHTPTTTLAIARSVLRIPSGVSS